MKKALTILLAAYSLQLTAITGYASSTIDNAWKYFLKGDYRKSIKEAEGTEGAQAHYVMGLSYLKLGRPSHARKHFVFILDVYPQTDIKEQTFLSIADSYFLEGDFKNAAIKYIDFLNKFSSSGLRSLVYLKLGQSQRRLGYWSEAKASLSKVIRDFPNSFEKTEAQKELLKEFYYYIQVASFSRKVNATRTYNTLKKKNFNVYINKIEKDKKIFYRVCVGKFQNKKDAAFILKKLKLNGYKAKVYP